MARTHIGSTDVRRLLAALISQFQNKRIAQGQIRSSAHIDAVAVHQPGQSIDSIAVDEDSLGIDSLALLDLVMEVARFFNLHDTGVEDYLMVQRTLGEWVALVDLHLKKVGDDARITFSTSGSTGVPKHVVKPLSVTADEARAIGEYLSQNTPRIKRILSSVAPHHIYGFLWSVCVPHVMKSSVQDCYKTSPLRLGTISKPGDMILATPHLWEKFAEFGVSFAPDCVGVSSGGPTTEKTWGAMRQVGLTKVFEVYGSTETGGVGIRMSAPDPFTLLSHLHFDGQTLRRRLDQSALDVQDDLGWTGTTHFRTLGRKDEVVQIAGTNVNLAHVRTQMAALECVDQLAVRFDGDRLKAFVVPKQDSTVEIEDEIWCCLKELPAVARPASISFGPCLPRSETGKLSDW